LENLNCETPSSNFIISFSFSLILLIIFFLFLNKTIS
jgi:hypothetical protein